MEKRRPVHPYWNLETSELLKQRHKVLRDTPPQNLSIHFAAYVTLFEELFDKMKLKLGNGFSFLDIGCAPGGFSYFLLNRTGCSRGCGITLSRGKGGFPMLIDGFPLNYEVYEYDLLSNDPNPARLGLFQIVSADAQYLVARKRKHWYSGVKFQCVAAARVALLVKQFLIGLTALDTGGTFIWRSFAHNYLQDAQFKLFALIIDLFDSVRPFKSEFVHSVDLSFYCVCTGFKRSQYFSRNIGMHLNSAFTQLREQELEPMVEPPPPAVSPSMLIVQPPVDGMRILDELYGDIPSEAGTAYYDCVYGMFDIVWRWVAIGEANACEAWKRKRAAT